MSAETEAPTEDVVSKYKRLLTLARSSLEANQTSIAAKDKYITQLQKALDDEKAQRQNKIGRSGGKDEESLIPRNILRRVDVEEKIWVLIEYDGSEDSWMCFGSNQELQDFVQRVPGVPLVIPQRCFSASESSRIESESRKRVDRVVEEFRRYKVRTEIARKSKDAESKLAVQRNSMSVLNASNSAPQSLSPSASLAALAQADSSPNGAQEFCNSSEFHRLKAQLSEQETKWRKAYEKVVKENELLRTRGGETVLAVQWRERYEACLRERDAALEKLKIVGTGSSDRTGQSDIEGSSVRRGEGILSGEQTVEQAYNELRDEYKEFRHRVRAAEERRQKEKAQHSHPPARSSNSANGERGGGSNGHHGGEINSDIYSTDGPGGGTGGGGQGMRGMGLGESKIQYVRHMVFQYLTCKDAIVKPHIESALIALFRYNDTERLAIDDQRKADTEDTITSITNYLGLFTV